MHRSVFMSSCLLQDPLQECIALEDSTACKSGVLSCVPLLNLQLA